MSAPGVGVLIGPFTPGFVADQGLAPLAEIGVILMFGVGMHFSLSDLLAVRGNGRTALVRQGSQASIFVRAACERPRVARRLSSRPY